MEKVKSGDLIGYTGETGNAFGVPNPHLHFEIGSKLSSGNKEGTKNRTNPAFYVRLTSINVDLQTQIKDKRK